MASQQTTQHLTVGERLRLARERSGWSVKDFADHINMHRNNIPRWEARDAEPSFAVLRLYAENCRGATEEWLAFEIGDWPPLGGPNGNGDGSGFSVGYQLGDDQVTPRISDFPAISNELQAA